MASRHITVADLVEITGLSRHQLRNLLSALPGMGNEGGGARHATTFTHQDVAVIAVCAELECKFGLRRDALARLCPHIRAAFAGPKPLAQGAFVHVEPWADRVEYHSHIPNAAAGLLMPLTDVVRRIDAHFTPEVQRPLGFGPQAVAANEGQKAQVVKVASEKKS